MEPQRSVGQQGFWPTCLAVFVAGWVGGLAVGFFWGMLGTYGATVELMRGFGSTPRHGNLLEVIGLTLVGQGLLRAAVGALVLPRVEEQPVGSDPAGVLPSIDGLEQIRTAFLDLRAAGYRVDAQAWQLSV
jgi:hypothetical protein